MIDKLKHKQPSKHKNEKLTNYTVREFGTERSIAASKMTVSNVIYFLKIKYIPEGHGLEPTHTCVSIYSTLFLLTKINIPLMRKKCSRMYTRIPMMSHRVFTRTLLRDFSTLILRWRFIIMPQTPDKKKRNNINTYYINKYNSILKFKYKASFKEHNNMEWNGMYLQRRSQST